MRTFRPAARFVVAQVAAVALVVGACSTSSTSGTPAGTGGAPSMSGTSPGPPAPSSSHSDPGAGISPQDLLTAADYVRAGVAPEFAQAEQRKSASSTRDQRAVFGCWAVADVLMRVPGTTVEAKAVRAFIDRSKRHDVAQVLLQFASPAQAQRYGAAVARRLAACPHPKLGVAGVGRVFSNSSAEQLTTACDRSGGFTAIATRAMPHGSNSLVLAMLLISAGPTFSLTLLLGPLSSNDPVQRSKVANAACARLRG